MESAAAATVTDAAVTLEVSAPEIPNTPPEVSDHVEKWVFGVAGTVGANVNADEFVLARVAAAFHEHACLVADSDAPVVPGSAELRFTAVR